MAAYIYLVAMYDEDGITTPWVATTNRTKLYALCKSTYPWLETAISGATPGTNLTTLLEKTDADLAAAHHGNIFMPGVGGPVLYVVEVS